MIGVEEREREREREKRGSQLCSIIYLSRTLGRRLRLRRSNLNTCALLFRVRVLRARAFVVRPLDWALHTPDF